jgi:hypothetical protein
MSTTTNFKRIALVAVAALGLGVLSSVPSQAVGNLVVTTVNGTTAAGQSDSTTAATISLSATIEDARDTITVSFVGNGTLGDSVTSSASNTAWRAARLIYLDTTTAARSLVGDGVITAPAAVDKLESVTAGTSYYLSSASLGNVGAKFGIQLDSHTAQVAGTYSFTVFVKQYTQGVAQPVTTSYPVSVVSALPANLSVTASAAQSTAVLSAATSGGAWQATAIDSVVSTVSTASTTAAAVVRVTLLNDAGGGSTILDSLTVSIDKGNVGLTNATTPTGRSLAAVTYSGASQDVWIFADGSSGVATLTIKTLNAGTFTKTLNWYTEAAKTITATVGTPVLKVGANTGAVRGVATDANGNVWTGQAYIVASSAADALIAGSTTPVACAAYDAVNARHNCPITGTKAGTAKFKIIDAATVALATATSNEVTVTVSAATATSVKIEFDKASYAPNERARIYVTPLNAAGQAIQSATYTDIVSSTGISVNGIISFTGTTTTADSFTASTLTSARNFTTADQSSATSGARAGSQMFTVYMPSSGGTVTLNATGGPSLPAAGQVALTATATVTDSGAAALAAVTALATTVASLRTLIVTLTNLVLKIQKKVRA